MCVHFAQLDLKCPGAATTTHLCIVQTLAWTLAWTWVWVWAWVWAWAWAWAWTSTWTSAWALARLSSWYVVQDNFQVGESTVTNSVNILSWKLWLLGGSWPNLEFSWLSSCTLAWEELWVALGLGPDNCSTTGEGMTVDEAFLAVFVTFSVKLVAEEPFLE